MSTPQLGRRGASITRVAQSTIFTALALAAMVLGSLAGPIASANAADGCADVEVVFARGTNEAPGVGATGQAFVDALAADLPGKTVDVYGVNYPASLNFGQAVDGIADASNRIQSIAATCPATKIVLGGYSQGAAVAGYTTSSSVPAGFVLPAGISGPMPASIASHVAAVALFGTPDEWVLGLADRSAPPIAIGQPYVAKTIQLCAAGDPICFPGGLNRAAHSSYKDNGMAIQAADFAVHQLVGSARAATVVQTAGEVGAN
ncbi:MULTISPECIES: cutinase family protein [unclassified Mycolicibacterium]|uniref:cutinase family protein n=1 Tax=unclassified Mycolicibacterium TaxID=2636767 RepID=UPI0012DBF9B7|nr:MULTISPECIES: cutinase family protein [unclassified Mycolicibacterium]MUL83700.1 cutinase family protein [Mycolicibacterium sp. CBMA 329]MUL90691.1 cutinase family protein [Mycolicibacterium sp. CBMA 331]MUM00660.1 cutinase family protein [Mycolicibacterium sp. CBMA 334]MUM28632.1 cutinase family protein [Mycolicibacterium sp. CBMA 295]MUM41635.1 cutinase family protein [Mycolicibacterium sp. CBMA 247]